MNRVRSERAGYTILETMIFLLVSGILFFSAMLLVNGQQNKTEFTTVVRDFDTKLQSVIGNVSSGYYNNPGSVTCTVAAGPPRQPQITSTPSVQGQNEGCTFVGQYITLPTPPAPADNFTITSHAGLRLNDAGEEVQSLAEARPTPINETTETYNLLNGVRAKMRIVNGADITTVAITPTFNSYNSLGFLDSGSSRVQLHAITGAGVDTIDPTDGIQICLIEDPGDDNTGPGQTGLIFLNTGSTRVTVDNDTGACPW